MGRAMPAIGAGRILRHLAAGVLLILGGSAAVSGQDLANYDYDQLSFRGIGLDAGYIFPNKVEDAAQYSLRIDMGYLGPGVRILPRIGYFSSTMTGVEVAGLEERVADLVFEQNPFSPRPVVDLGGISWSALTLGLDAQIVWRVKNRFLTYLGAGAAAHLQNGSGASIDGTFIEELLDGPVAGGNVHAGLEVPLGSMVRIYADARYELLGDLRFPALRAGLQFMTSRTSPGEMN